MFLITGANGQLGRCLSCLLPADTIKLTDVVSSNENGRVVDALDITNLEAVKEYVKANAIDCIINCAAYTAVDKAEDEKELAYQINAIGPKNLALSQVANIIHVSTDYVFDGKTDKKLTPEDKVNPISVYGVTKLQGEEELLQNAVGSVVIIRTAWLYSIYGNNFVKSMRRLGQERASLNVVDDQHGTPTFAEDLASAIVVVANKMLSSADKIKEVYHYSNEGECTWCDFAKAIMEISCINCVVNPIPTSGYPTKATRPMFSVLDKSKIKAHFGIEIPHWLDSLKICISKMN